MRGSMWRMPKLDEAAIGQAVQRLQHAAPGATVVLFGSYGRGDARDDSDLDVLIIEPTVVSRHAEMVRLRDVLADCPVPVDVLVVSQQQYDAWAQEAGTVLHAAATEGRAFEPAG